MFHSNRTWHSIMNLSSAVERIERENIWSSCFCSSSKVIYEGLTMSQKFSCGCRWSSIQTSVCGVCVCCFYVERVYHYICAVSVWTTCLMCSELGKERCYWIFFCPCQHHHWEEEATVEGRGIQESNTIKEVAAPSAAFSSITHTHYIVPFVFSLLTNQ